MSAKEVNLNSSQQVPQSKTRTDARDMSRAAELRGQFGVPNTRLGGGELLGLLGLRGRGADPTDENADPEAVNSRKYYDDLADRLTPPRTGRPSSSTATDRTTSTREPGSLARALRDENVTLCAHMSRNGRSRRPRLLRASHKGGERRATSSTLYCGECEERLVAKRLVEPEKKARVRETAPAETSRVKAATEPPEQRVPHGSRRAPEDHLAPGFSERTTRMLETRRRNRVALLEAQLALVKRMEGVGEETQKQERPARVGTHTSIPVSASTPTPEPNERVESRVSHSRVHDSRVHDSRPAPRPARTPIASPGAGRMHDTLVAGSMSDTSLLADIERLMRMSSADAAATPGEPAYELSPSPSK